MLNVMLKRTNTCGELTASSIGKDVCLHGWISTIRDHGGVLFADLRDRYGLTQVVFHPEKQFFPDAEKLRREDCIAVQGRVAARPKGMENLKLPTGEIEILVEKLLVHSKSEVPPIEVDDRIAASDDLRLKYRYLDLRRPVMQHHLAMRHKAAQAARTYLAANSFLEVETPFLIKSTPEGARDYIVPSRVNPGMFYALPQSPQLYKQILMCSGMDRYFQLARCLRDEDLRADRQPEHTQIDLEMSFVEPEDVFAIVEGLIKTIWKECIGYDVKTPFPRIPHQESMRRYGTDKPDIRYDLFLHDVTALASESDFSVFKDVAAKGGVVKCIASPKELTRGDIDKYIEFCQQQGAKGMAWMRAVDGKLESSIVKFFSPALQQKLLDAIKPASGSVIMFIADKPTLVNQVLDKLRQDLARRFALFNPKDFKFSWITEFPLFEWNEDEEKWDPAHHPFCMPKWEDIQYLESDPGRVYCTQYDLAMNGWELGSGSIRIHRPDIQERVLKVIGLAKKDLENRFGFLLEAFKYGAPPHGGIGIGFDRVVTLMLGLQDIRDVIAFPKNKAAQCPMDGSPSDVPEKSLKELHIKVDLGKK
ncbi:aspartate--tRNA ligase [Candidatus Woesearchaeota archaeon]|nr:aspartate--tRNA ligase [Candidatus Woesearchaeota archaeon]